MIHISDPHPDIKSNRLIFQFTKMQQYIDYSQDTLEEVEPVLLEAMSLIRPSNSLNSINGSVLTQDEGGQARFYLWNSNWVLIRTLNGDPNNPIILYYRNAEEVVVGIGESEPWYVEVQLVHNGPHFILWDATPQLRAGQTGLEEMFGGMNIESQGGQPAARVSYSHRQTGQTGQTELEEMFGGMNIESRGRQPAARVRSSQGRRRR
jgi:hypothetical protein